MGRGWEGNGNGNYESRSWSWNFEVRGAKGLHGKGTGNGNDKEQEGAGRDRNESGSWNGKVTGSQWTRLGREWEWEWERQELGREGNVSTSEGAWEGEGKEGDELKEVEGRGSRLGTGNGNEKRWEGVERNEERGT